MRRPLPTAVRLLASAATLLLVALLAWTVQLRSADAPGPCRDSFEIPVRVGGPVVSRACAAERPSALPVFAAGAIAGLTVWLATSEVVWGRRGISRLGRDRQGEPAPGPR